MDKINEIAANKRCTPAQVALAWLLHQPYSIGPIPGTRSPQRLEENAGAVDISMNEDEMDTLSGFFAGHVHGLRYPEAAFQLIETH